MKVLAKLLVGALAFAAVANGADNLRAGCEANDATPAPTTTGKPLPTPAPTTLAPTTPVVTTAGPTPAITTPAPTTAGPTTTPAPSTPAPTTPAPTTPAPSTPAPTTPAPTTPATTTPAPTTPAPTSPAPTTPAPTTPAPTTPAPTTSAPTTPEPTTPAATTPAPSTAKPAFSKDAEYRREGVDCNGLLRLPGPAGLSKTNCVEDYKVVFTEGAAPVTGCVACKYTYTRVKGEVPLCGGLPLCTIFSGYGDLVEADLMCVLDTNGAKPIDTGCSFFDN